MQRFAIGFFGIFIIGFAAIWLWMIQNPSSYLDDEYPMWAAKMEMVHECQLGSVTIIGDSGPFANLIPSRIGAGVVNLAFGGHSPVETYFFARRILSCPIPPKAIIISFSIKHFAEVDEFWNRAARFGVLDFSDFEDARQNAHLRGGGPYPEKKNGDVDMIIQEMAYAHWFPPYYFYSIVWAVLYPRIENNNSVFKDTKDARGWLHNFRTDPGSKALRDETFYDHFPLSSFSDYYFNQIVGLFENRHIPVYFLNMPYSDVSASAMKNNVVQDFTAYLHDEVKKHPGLHLLDEPFPIMSWTEFGDNAHLNPDGAKQFSEQVRQMLNDAHVEGGPFVPENDGGDNATRN